MPGRRRGGSRLVEWEGASEAASAAAGAGVVVVGSSGDSVVDVLELRRLRMLGRLRMLKRRRRLSSCGKAEQAATKTSASAHHLWRTRHY